MTPVLNLTDVSRAYRQGEARLTVFADLSLTVRAGEAVGLVGVSGAGKTTLLYLAGLLERPDSGEVTLAGQATSRLSQSRRDQVRGRKIGFVYQFHNLLPDFSALENVMLPQLIAGAARGAAEQQAQTLLESVGVGHRATHRPAKLSGGEQQRVAIARALANDPDLVIADEPTGNLDPATAEQVFALLTTRVRGSGKALLMATHNRELAGQLDRVVMLAGGVLRELGAQNA
jgi:lipoprotein-releasing system ATP-binding protein